MTTNIHIANRYPWQLNINIANRSVSTATKYHHSKQVLFVFVFQRRQRSGVELVPEHLLVHPLHREGPLQDQIRLLRHMWVSDHVIYYGTPLGDPLNWCKNESDIASKWVHRESN